MFRGAINNPDHAPLNPLEVTMNKAMVISSLGIGAAVIVILFLFWSFSRYFKKRLAPESSGQFISPLIKEPWEEKRQHPRVAVSWNATAETPDGVIDVQLKDISLGGAFVVCDKPMALQEKFRLAIKIPEQEPLELNAEVVWSNFNVPADKVVNRGMGIRFVENTEKDRKKLNAVVKSVFTIEAKAA
jgi:Tfp pilus assembly protein PilZ